MRKETRKAIKEYFRSFNPFRDLIETGHFINARTQRVGFFTKVKDTFYVINGVTKGDSPYKRHAGLLDWATLFAPSVIRGVFNWSKAVFLLPNPPLDALFIAGFVIIPSALTHCLIRYVAKPAAAAILTIMLLPVVGIIHSLASIWGSRHKKNAYSLEVVDKANLDSRSYLGDFANEFDESSTHKESIIRFRADCVTNGQDHNVDLTFYTMNHFLRKNVKFSLSMDLNKPEQKQAFQSMLALNLGGLTYKLDKKGYNPKTIFFTKDNKGLVGIDTTKKKANKPA